jgi:hypothetical protein
VTRELTTGGWRDDGQFTWLLTSLRAVGHSASSGKLVSIPWACLADAHVDTRGEVVVVEMCNGWTGRLSGPGVLSIVVMVVAALHGVTERWAPHAS